MPRSEEDRKLADQMFDKFRDDLLKRDLSNTENYDKTVLALSTATLGFSLIIVKDLVKVSTACHTWLLYLSWVFLVAVIIASILAYAIGNMAISKELEKAREYYKNENEEAFGEKNIYKSVNTVLNFSSGIFVSLAILLLVSFIGINLSKESVMVEENQLPSEKKSSNIPSMERVIVPGSKEKISSNIPTIERLPSSGSTSSEGSSGGSSSSSN